MTSLASSLRFVRDVFPPRESRVRAFLGDVLSAAGCETSYQARDERRLILHAPYGNSISRFFSRESSVGDSGVQWRSLLSSAYEKTRVRARSFGQGIEGIARRCFGYSMTSPSRRPSWRHDTRAHTRIRARHVGQTKRFEGSGPTPSILAERGCSYHRGSVAPFLALCFLSLRFFDVFLANKYLQAAEASHDKRSRYTFELSRDGQFNVEAECGINRITLKRNVRSVLFFFFIGFMVNIPLRNISPLFLDVLLASSSCLTRC